MCRHKARAQQSPRCCNWAVRWLGRRAHPMGVRRVGGEGGTGARGAVLTWILAIAVFTAAVSLLTQHHAIHDLHEPRSSHHGLRNHHRHGAATRTEHAVNRRATEDGGSTQHPNPRRDPDVLGGR